MQLYSYIVARDYGFAPNPFNGYCTLATCKQDIRGSAKIGDWVIGTGAKIKHRIPGRLIFAMRVTEKLSFNEYWNDSRFQCKKPHLNGSLKQTFGDNIYFFDNSTNSWHQEDSHHSYENGVINLHNLNKDTSHPYVLISNHFYYFGRAHILIPENLQGICVKKQGHKKNHDPDLVSSFIQWVEANPEKGYIADPLQFDTFERYNGL